MKSITGNEKNLIVKDSLGGRLQVTYNETDINNAIKKHEAFQSATQLVIGNRALSKYRKIAKSNYTITCTAFLEINDISAFQENSLLNAKIYTANHCLSLRYIKSASLTLIASSEKNKYSNATYKKYAPMNVHFKTIDILKDLEANVQPAQWEAIRDGFDQFSEFDLKELGQFFIDEDTSSKEAPTNYAFRLIDDLNKELKSFDGEYYCQTKIDPASLKTEKYQKVCMLPTDLAAVDVSITINAGDEKTVRDFANTQIAARNSFTESLSSKEKQAVANWQFYIKERYPAAIQYGMTNAILGCQALPDTCDLNKLTEVLSKYEEHFKEANRDMGKIPDDLKSQLSAEDIKRVIMLSGLNQAAEAWYGLFPIMQKQERIFFHSNFIGKTEASVLKQNQSQFWFLSIPFTKMSISKEPVTIQFRSYGLTYENDAMDVKFGPGDSGTIMSLGGFFPLTVISSVNGYDTSGGTAGPKLPEIVKSTGEDGTDISGGTGTQIIPETNQRRRANYRPGTEWVNYENPDSENDPLLPDTPAFQSGTGEGERNAATAPPGLDPVTYDTPPNSDGESSDSVRNDPTTGDAPGC